MSKNQTYTFFVFKNSKEARVFNDTINKAHNHLMDRFFDFKVLPFAANPPKGMEPRVGQILRRFDHYPVSYIYIAQGIDHIIQDTAVNALNLSLGPSGFIFDPEDPLQLTTRFVYQMGIPVVVSAGNNGPSEGTLQPLAQAPWVISVGATDPKGNRLLEISSRGWRNGPFPTVVAEGWPMVSFISKKWSSFLPGTSFASPRVANLIILISKAFEILLGNLNDVASSRWSDLSRPVSLAVLGIADTGVDPRALDPLPEPVSTAVKSGIKHLVFPRTDQEQQWLKVMRKTLTSRNMSLPTKISPDILKQALKVIAHPIPGSHMHEAGFGFLSESLVTNFLTELTPVRFMSIICPNYQQKIMENELNQLDNKLGELWNNAYVSELKNCFYYGRLLNVARVV